MAIGGSGKGIQIVVGTDYNDRDLKRAQRDLDRLKGQAAQTAGPMAKLGNTIRSNVGPAMTMAAAAAGAFAVKFGIDAVQAAIADEAAAARLAQTLRNLGEAHQAAQVEDYIFQLQRSTGVVDDEMRPAFERLIRSTQNVDEAQRALAIALDISASKGKPLQSVADALGKAYDGNSASLGRLGLGLDTALLKSKDMGAITDELSRLFSGQASAAANTWAGRLQRINVAFDELKESFGSGLLGAIKDNGQGTEDFIDSMYELRPVLYDLGKQIGTIAQALSDLEKNTGIVTASFKGLLDVTGPTLDAILYFYRVMVLGEDPLEAFKQQFFGLGEAGEAAAAGMKAAGQEFGGGDWIPEATGDFDEFSGTVEDAESALAELNNEMKTFFGILDDRDALRGYQASIDDLRKSLAENGKSFNINTRAGRENQAALDDIYDSALKVAEGQATAAEKVKTMRDASAEANRVLKQMGVPKEVRDALLKPFDDAIIAFDTATTGARNLKQEMELIPRDVPITVTTTYVTKNADSQPPHQRAAGGLVTGPGTSTSDSIPVRMSNGEFVIRAASVKKFGPDFFSQLNQGINPLAGMTPTSSGRGGGFSIGSITVNSVAGEGADTSLPRALRRMAFLAGMNG